MILGHGDNQYQFPFKLKADFSSNVRHDGCSYELLNHLKTQLHLISNYPEPDGQSLREQLAKKHQLKASQVLLCNGSSDGFYQIAQAFSQVRTAILYPAFSEYEDACKMHGHQLSFVTKEEFHSTTFEDVDMVWLGNPNNPDGYIFDLKTIQNHLVASPKTIFVIDEAYIELCKNGSSAIELLPDFKNLIVCRSLTKNYGIPGIRLGYLLCNEAISHKLNQYLKPWSVNTLAMEAGKYILKNEGKLGPNVIEISRLSRNLQGKINQINGFRVVESSMGFFLVQVENSTASELKQYLLHEHAILIRSASNFRGLSKQHFRIGTQSEEKNGLLIEALRQFSKEIKPLIKMIQ